jgi:hypothetical protein
LRTVRELSPDSAVPEYQIVKERGALFKGRRAAVGSGQGRKRFPCPY